MIVLSLVLAAVFLLATIRWPRVALFSLLLFLPAYQIRVDFLGLPTTALEVMILAFYFGVLIGNFKTFGQIKKIFSGWLWVIPAWLGVGFIAALVSPNFTLGLGHWRAYFVGPILVLMAVVILIRRDEKLKELIIPTLAFSALICALWAVAQKFFGGGVMSTEVWGAAKVWRATGPFPQPNFLGLYLAPIAVLAFGQFIILVKKIDKKIIFYLAVYVFSIIALLLARSEGGLLALVFGTIFLLILYRPSRRATIIILIILFILLALIPTSRQYFVQKASFNGLSEQLRLNIWHGAADLIKAHPIFGVGLRGYQQLISHYQKPYYQPGTDKVISVETHPYPHNLFLALWAEAGLLGLIVFSLIVIKFFIQGFKKKSVFHLTLLAAMSAIIIHGLVDTPYFKNDLSVLFWFLISMMICF
ncbi:MAG: O-antigen ligase family protein [Patescibacteria group bacterium]|nr:O-antigen ligase family protein [Patescibacteria group bacterium]MDD5121216.1 O-antigen ligase family protein [Patescibacteria group bacterium]MDD5221755.1 O-antigen ligase family protein [Patescibacteria group bacterium]MDD5395865.1 O-antigen ligase family protein [Patescibacteria group bacterium]